MSRNLSQIKDIELANDAKESVLCNIGGHDYFIETSDERDLYGYAIEQAVINTKTQFQNIVIADSINFGRILVLDGAIQSAQDDEALYHEVLVQPAMVSHPKPQNVLVVGGGEGATLREVLKHKDVASVTMVDIDREAVEFCKEHLPSWHKHSFDDPRVTMVYEDGRAYLENNTKEYDVAIIDVVDMLDNGPAQRLYTKQFYQLLRKRLTKGAIVAVQGMEFSHLDWQQHSALAKTLETAFSQVHSYRTTIPSFLSSWGFIIASDWLNPLAEGPDFFQAKIEEKLQANPPEHIDGHFITGCFQLCKATKERLKHACPVLEDGVDFVHFT